MINGNIDDYVPLKKLYKKTIKDELLANPESYKKTVEDNIEFQKPQVYFTYTLCFLKKPIQMSTQFSVGLKKNKCTVWLKEMSSYDVKEINQELEKIRNGLHITGKNMFMNCTNSTFFDRSFPPISQPFEINKKWILKFEIQGYKIGLSGNESPILRLLAANEAFI